MAVRRRKKRRTHQPVTLENDGTPRSFVFAKGRPGPTITELVADIKRMMEPHTASRLKARKHNRVRDFIHVAGQYNVNFLMMVSSTDKAAYLRLVRVPRGPTLQYRIHRFSLAGDVASIVRRPHSPASGEFATPPLLVMHGFSKTLKQDQLASVMFQNLFPPIDVGKMNIKSCRRVVLVQHDSEAGRTHIRQYAITATPTGMSRPLKKLIRDGPSGKLALKLGRLEDISQLLDRDGYSSESGAETDLENEAVTLPQDYKGRGARKSQQCAIKLTELGPRLELELIKVEEGVCDGNVIYHRFHTKTPEEQAALEARARAKAETKAARKREQEENIRRKAEAKAAEAQARMGAKRKRGGAVDAEPAADGNAADADDDDDDDDDDGGGGRGPAADDDDDMSDAEWYRAEVGEEPDPALFTHRQDGEGEVKREKYNPLYAKRKKHAAKPGGRPPAAKQGAAAGRGAGRGRGRGRGRGGRRSAD